MAAKIRSQVFWLSYRHGADESVEDILVLARKVVNGDVNGNPGIFGNAVIRSGQPMVDMVVCSPKSQRIGVVTGKTKWQRSGARGEVCDARWPAEGETPRAFLRKWADAITQQRQGQFGSRRALFEALDSFHARDKARKRRSRARQRRQRRPPSPVDQPSSPQVVVDTPVPQPALADVAQLTQEEVGDCPWTFDDFTGVDFGSATKGLWSVLLHSVREANGSTSQEDPFLCGEGISTSAIDLALASHGIFPAEGCDVNPECGYDFTWHLNTEVVNADVDWSVDLEWNPDWNDLLDTTDLVV
ncbi:hypothetical protein HIM_11515 [Hirsutella minnesotensis 3608]|uniref:Uncharacterized protein n=1 Tax=Hirsutella minnesotensis 3608 TaxID=1043627 RepID=A0A0F7ZWJ7_9HYPO|nr:hypothetical protein HIM_11515 [Hirsutella minnesotensis 3608]